MSPLMRCAIIAVLLASTVSPVDATPIVGGRISAVSGDPTPETDVTTSSLFLVPVESNQTESWNGSAWVAYTYTGELQLTLSSSAHLASKGFDVFEAPISGDIALCSGPPWTNKITRSAAIEVFQGRMVNAAEMSCVNGSSTYTVAARAGLLRGGFWTSANGQTKSALSARLVWDLFRPAWQPVMRIDTAAYWYWSADGFHQANASAANQIAVFNGVSGRGVDITASGYMIGGTSTIVSGFVDIGLDSSSDPASQTKNPCAGSNAFPVLPCWARFTGFPGIGYHEFRWIERGTNGTNQKWIGSNGYGGYGYQTGLTGFVLQ
jgi:hypothetical protein